jgi:uncharacterized OB-fold protein
VRVAAPGFEAPYRIGYVRLDEGPRVLVQLSSESEAVLRPGHEVVVQSSGVDAILRAERLQS